MRRSPLGSLVTQSSPVSAVTTVKGLAYQETPPSTPRPLSTARATYPFETCTATQLCLKHAVWHCIHWDIVQRVQAHRCCICFRTSHKGTLTDKSIPIGDPSHSTEGRYFAVKSIICRSVRPTLLCELLRCVYTSSFGLLIKVRLLLKESSHCLKWHRKDKALLGMFCKNNFFSLRLRFALSGASMFPPALFLDTLSFEHCPLEF